MEKVKATSFSEGSMEGEKLFNGKVFPKTLFPPPPAPPAATSETGTSELVELIKKERAWLTMVLDQHGAILFKGFDVESPETFACVVEAFGWEEFEYEGPADRIKVANRIFTASEAPLHIFINFHHEMALIKQFASKIFFFCLEPPREGGQTSIIRSDIIAEEMEKAAPDVVEKLTQEGLKFVLHTKAPYKRIDAASDDSNFSYVWQRMLKTKDEFEAKERALKTLACNSASFNGDGSADFFYGPMNPLREFNGRKVWFNTILGYQREERDGYSSYGDGTPISSEAMQTYEKILKENSVDVTWQKGDILLVDNLTVQHARRPGKPPRVVLLSLCK